MDKTASESIMKFILEGKPVYAECVLAIDSSDTMMKDFQGAKPGVSPYPNFFEVTDFDFGLSLKESDNGGVSASGGAFARWRSASQTDYKTIKYPLEFDKFSFSRLIDRASPILFQGCCTSQTFDSAVLVKRVAQGQSGGLSRPSVGYLRVDFTSVLITGLDWSDGEVVKEKCEFICQKMDVTIRRQTVDGSISSDKEVKASWPNPDNDRSLNIRSAAPGGGQS